MEPLPIHAARARYQDLMAGPRGLLELADADDPRTALVPPAALVFALGAWEAFCEEILRAAAVVVVGAARGPEDLPRAVTDTLVEVVGLSGEGWDRVLRRMGAGWHTLAVRHLGTSLDHKFRYWNTPSGAGVDRLAEQVAGMGPISPGWPTIDGQPAAARLDDAIRRRGEAVHLARTALTAAQVAEDLDLLDAVVGVTGDAVAARIARAPLADARG